MQDHEFYVVYIYNNGATIPQKVDIFEAGFSTKESESRGYGLYIVKKLLEKYNGQILLGVLKTTLVFLVAFAPFRCFGGGTHLSSGKRCVLVSTVMFIAFGYLSCIVISKHFLIILVIITILLGLYTTIRWVPAGRLKRPITDKRIQYMQKVNMFVALFMQQQP